MSSLRRYSLSILCFRLANIPLSSVGAIRVYNGVSAGFSNGGMAQLLVPGGQCLEAPVLCYSGKHTYIGVCVVWIAMDLFSGLRSEFACLDFRKRLQGLTI
jgi:hypothetical protein